MYNDVNVVINVGIIIYHYNNSSGFIYIIHSVEAHFESFLREPIKFFYFSLRYATNEITIILSIKLTLRLCYVKCMLLALTPSELDGTKENHQGITGMFQLWNETKKS